MNLMIYVIVIFCLTFTGCTTKSHTRPLLGLSECHNAEAIAHALEAKPLSEKADLSADEIVWLKSVRIFDDQIPGHPRYFDKIVDVEARLVERSHLNINGSIDSVDRLVLDPKVFWKPVILLCGYREAFGRFPTLSTVYCSALEAELSKYR